MAGGGGAGSSTGGSGGGGGREGDWDCGGCGNRNYAFRSLCNRCKQPRLLVDPNTPPDSKWLPRAGDWICTGNTCSAAPTTLPPCSN
ncbi:Os04g0110600 [Oryza sativa Japonica Group]|uniref:Os04g0110600 protein n=2 Tax=Oryza sativa subsp. japonica TaxID=39947 RepID=Q0JFE3_ORYSJ|nr:Os04g0110600 [Oryza sativa Japonica Group]BAS87571.1 Os04g0110600 [Oryza sativa Japonica Group]|eukprot:NP_001052030.1 Os04g0110600 [Oryza sativa Japonica Group]